MGSPTLAPEALPSSHHPNVLLVILDTLRADAVSPQDTPVLTRLSEIGVTYEGAHTSGTWSWPSHASMFLGMPPWEHGAHFDREGVQWNTLDPITISMPRTDTTTLAERFSAAGYMTVMVTANPWLREGVGLDRGFDSVLFDKDDNVVVNHVRAGLVSDSEQPLFLTVNLMSAHSPFSTDDSCEFTAQQRAWLDSDELAPYRTEGELNIVRGSSIHDFGVFAYARGELPLSELSISTFAAAYRCSVGKADARLAEVLSAWAATGRDGVIAVTSDHGELLGEHGRWEHGRDVWPELSHVPLVIAAPGMIPAGQRIEGEVLLHGIYGELLHLAGLASPEDARLVPGQPRRVKAWSDRMWAEHVGGRFEHDATLYAEGGTARLAWGEEESFFDLQVDPGLVAPISPPAEAEALRATAVNAFPETDAPSVAPNLTSETQRALEELGYLEPQPE